MGNVNKLNRVIFGNSRMELTFFMYFPKGNPVKDTFNISINPVLFLRYKKPDKYSSEYDMSKASYKITNKNIYKVVSFFNVLMRWMYDENFKDIFLLDESNDLVFNADYNNLSASTPVDDYTSTVLRAIPSIISFGDKKYEGIKLYINSSAYCISMTKDEVAIVYGILKNIDFSNEINTMLMSFSIIEKYKLYEKPKEYKSYKTPFDT